jgi:hypothetical protein
MESRCSTRTLRVSRSAPCNFGSRYHHNRCREHRPLVIGDVALYDNPIANSNAAEVDGHECLLGSAACQRRPHSVPTPAPADPHLCVWRIRRLELRHDAGTLRSGARLAPGTTGLGVAGCGETQGQHSGVYIVPLLPSKRDIKLLDTPARASAYPTKELPKRSEQRHLHYPGAPTLTCAASVFLRGQQLQQTFVALTKRRLGTE